MDKLVIFNVGGAMSSYCEIGGKRIIVDIGTRTDFSPVLHFLLPYARSQNWNKSIASGHQTKYHIDQLIVSHPHRDHVSDIENLYEHFYPEFVTTPNDNDGMEDESLNWDLVFGKNTPDVTVKFFKDNLIHGRTPPLKSVVSQFELYYIPPGKVEENIPTNDYVNSTSLVCIINLQQGRRIMLPGDMMESGMKWMLENDVVHIIPGTKTEKKFKNAIEKVSILVAPHHGLESAFCIEALKEMKDNLKLVIIPEKPTTEDDRRQVHQRYYSREFGTGTDITTFETQATERGQGTVKTSTGHIIISGSNLLKVTDNANLIRAFTSL